MTIGEWIDGQERAVPVGFRSWLTAAGPVSLDALLDAADCEVVKHAAHSNRDREAAFHLLAADAYLTYACALGVAEGTDGEALGELARRVARRWRDRLG